MNSVQTCWDDRISCQYLGHNLLFMLAILGASMRCGRCRATYTWLQSSSLVRSRTARRRGWSRTTSTATRTWRTSCRPTSTRPLRVTGQRWAITLLMNETLWSPHGQREPRTNTSSSQPMILLTWNSPFPVHYLFRSLMRRRQEQNRCLSPITSVFSKLCIGLYADQNSRLWYFPATSYITSTSWSVTVTMSIQDIRCFS